MPFYDYECPSCGKQWEGFNRMKDCDKEVCSCGDKPNIRITGIQIRVWMTFVEENLSWRPVEISDPKQLRQLCKNKKIDFDSVVESRRKHEE
jgi:putative FmdB family regulatory protein